LVKKASTRMVAVSMSGRRCVCLMSAGNVMVLSTNLCLLGSIVNDEGPETLSTIIRMSCRKDRVAESPIYTTFSQL